MAWVKLLLVRKVLLTVKDKFNANQEVHDEIKKMNLIAVRLQLYRARFFRYMGPTFEDRQAKTIKRCITFGVNFQKN